MYQKYYISLRRKSAIVMKKNRYVVWVHVAPYVCRYLVDNFGVEDPEIKNLVNINGDPALMAFFTPKLMKQSNRYDRRNEHKVGFRTARVAIEVSAEKFSRNGWALSPTDEASFARLLELRCQGILLSFLSAHYMISGDAAASIRKFYKVFHQNERTWPYDSIRKIWNRNVSKETKITIKSALDREIIEKILVQLSSFGTISQKGLELYEND